MMIRKYFAVFAAIAVMATSIPAVPIYADETVSADTAEEGQKDVSEDEDEDKGVQNGEKDAQDEEGSSVSEDAKTPSSAEEDVKADSDSVDEESVSENKADDKSVSGDSVSDDAVDITVDEENKTVSSGNASYTLMYDDWGDGLEVTGYTGTAEGELIIPSEVDGKPVVGIEYKAFKDCSGFTGSLTIPSTVTSIGSYAFDGCSGLTGSLTIPGGIETIPEGAFKNCTGLTGLVIQNGVKKIDSSWDYDYDDNDNRVYDYSGAFSGCKNIAGTLTIPGSVKELDGRAFYGTGISGLVIEDGVESVSGFEGFKSLKGTLTIPETVKEIRGSAFESCSGLTGTLTIPGSIETIPAQAFMNCTGLTGLVIQDGVKEIDGSKEPHYYDDDRIGYDYYGAFSGCKNLRGTLTIPGSVKNLDGDAFYGTKFSRLVIEDGVESVFCFGSFKTLKGTLTIPSTVKQIGSYAFANCTGLSGLVIKNGVKTLDMSAFDGCRNIKGTLTIPGTVEEIGESAFEDCTGLTGLVLKNGVKKLGNGAFYGCKNIKGTLTIPGSVKDLNGKAFYGTSISGLVLKNGVESVSGFEDFKTLKGKLVFPNSVENIAESAFEGCTGITSVNIPYDVAEIKRRSFYGCTGLKSVTIKGAEIIGERAFENCTGLEGKLNLPSTVETIGENAFRGCSGITGLGLKKGITEIKSHSFDGCIGLSGKLAFPNTLKNIGNYAFNECCGITEVTLPASVEDNHNSYNSPFDYCYGIKKITNKSTQPISLYYLLRDNEYFKDAKSGKRIDQYSARVKSGTFVKVGNSKPAKAELRSVKNSSNGLTVTWRRQRGVTGYYVFRSENGGKYKKIATVLSAPSYPWQDESGYYEDRKATGAGKKYSYKVCAYNAIGKNITKGAFSSEKTAVRLYTPEITELSSTSSRSLTVKWKGNTTNSGYEIQCSRDNKFKDAKTVNVTPGKTASKKITNLKGDKTYYVRIRPFKKSGKVTNYGVWSKVKSVKVKK